METAAVQEKTLTPYSLIKQRAKERGQTLGDIARVAGTTRMAITHVASGRSKSKRLRLAICNELQLHPGELGWDNIYVN